jgi:peptidoglycan/LPS O-acetylase OafA/YrhL
MINYRLTEGASVILDLIRGITAQLVVFGHGIAFFGVFRVLHEPNFPWIQNIGVLIFFILSGFLITYSTINKINFREGYRFKHFFIDRFSRIYTAFIPSIIFVLIVDLISQNISPAGYSHLDSFDTKTFTGNLFMLQDFPFMEKITGVDITSFGSARPFWTLAVEWWIYLFFGYFMIKFIRERITVFSVIIMLVLSIVPIYNTLDGRGHGLFVYWVFGAIVYFMINHNMLKHVSKTVKIGLLLGFLGLAGVKGLMTANAYEPIFAFLLSCSLLLTIDLFREVKFSKITAKSIRVMANYSYTLYLVHYTILDFLKTHFGDKDPYLLLILGFVLSNLISFLIGYYTETRLTKFVKSKLYIKFG